MHTSTLPKNRKKYLAASLIRLNDIEPHSFLEWSLYMKQEVPYFHYFFWKTHPRKVGRKGSRWSASHLLAFSEEGADQTGGRWLQTLVKGHLKSATLLVPHRLLRTKLLALWMGQPWSSTWAVLSRNWRLQCMKIPAMVERWHLSLLKLSSADKCPQACERKVCDINFLQVRALCYSSVWRVLSPNPIFNFK